MEKLIEDSDYCSPLKHFYKLESNNLEGTITNALGDIFKIQEKITHEFLMIRFSNIEA